MNRSNPPVVKRCNVRKDFLEQQLNAACPQDDPYNITHVTHWADLKDFFDDLFDGGHEAIDLIALDVNFSKLPSKQLRNLTPQQLAGRQAQYEMNYDRELRLRGVNPRYLVLKHLTAPNYLKNPTRF